MGVDKPKRSGVFLCYSIEIIGEIPACVVNAGVIGGVHQDRSSIDSQDIARCRECDERFFKHNAR